MIEIRNNYRNQGNTPKSSKIKNQAKLRKSIRIKESKDTVQEIEIELQTQITEIKMQYLHRFITKLAKKGDRKAVQICNNARLEM